MPDLNGRQSITAPILDSSMFAVIIRKLKPV